MSPRVASRSSCVVFAWVLAAALLGCTDVGEVGVSRAGGAGSGGAAGSSDDGQAGNDDGEAGNGGGEAGNDDGEAGATADAGAPDSGDDDSVDQLDEDDCEESCACSDVVACPDDWLCSGALCVECDPTTPCEDGEVCDMAGRCVDP